MTEILVGVTIVVVSALILWGIKKGRRVYSIRKATTVNVEETYPILTPSTMNIPTQAIYTDSITITISIAKQESLVISDFYVEAEGWSQPWRRKTNPFGQTTLTHSKPVRVSRGMKEIRKRFARAGVKLPGKCRAVFVSEYGKHKSDWFEVGTQRPGAI